MEVLIEKDTIYNRVKIKPIPRISVSWFLFWLIWPFGALVSAMRNFRLSYAKTVFWIFCIYFGFVFIYADPYGQGGADSSRYAKQLIDLHSNPFDISQLVGTFYSSNEGLTDIYQPAVTWFVAFFTDDPRFLFAFFAAVFGYFWVQNLWIIFSRINDRAGLVLILFLIGFALINPIWNINGVRMWTAAQIFLFGILTYYLNGNKKGILWTFLAIPVHFSFMFPVGIFMFFIFVPNYIGIFFLFYVSASFIKEIDLGAVRDSLSFLPEVFQPKVESYTGEAYAKRIIEAKDEMAWHVQFAGLANRIILYAWLIYAFINRKKWIVPNSPTEKVFGFALLLGGFAQIASLVPSGGRFMTVVNSLLYIVFIFAIINIKPGLTGKLLRAVTFPLLLFVIVFSIRRGFDYIGILTLFGNPIIAIFSQEQVPLIDFVKQLF